MSSQNTSQSAVAHFAIEGEMTIYRASELKSTILPHLSQADEIEIDLSKVQEIDSAGLQLLIATKLEAVAHDKKLRFVGHSKPVLEALDLCDLVAFFGDQVILSANTEH